MEREQVAGADPCGAHAVPWGARAVDEARDRLLRLGASALTDAELLELLLGACPRVAEAGTLAQELLSVAGGLKALLQSDPQDLCARPGLGPSRAAQLLCALELGRRAQKAQEVRPRLRTPEDIHRYLWPGMATLRREVFHVLCFNARNVLLQDARVAEGSMNQCPVDPREVFAPALLARASAVVLAHNHPSGDPEPSAEDLHLTRQLARGGELLGIRVLDHLILGDGTYVSVAARGLIGDISRGNRSPALVAHGAGSTHRRALTIRGET